MGKFDGVLLVSDFDDTLYSGKNQVSPRNLEALDYFISRGGRFTVATGRAHRTFAPYAHLVPLNAPAVLSNGSALYDFQKGEMVVQTFLSSSVIPDFQAVCGEFSHLALEAYNGEDIYAYRPNHVTDAHMVKVGTDYTQVDNIADIPLPWTKAILQQDWDKLSPVQPWFLERYGEKYEAIFSNQVYLEITEKGSNKGGMVTRLAQLLNIAPEHIYCVGDNQNDIPMLEVSAIPFAPSNCSEQVRNFGARILSSCEEGVMGDVVDILDGIY